MKTPPATPFDLAVIGGGAAGFFGAISCAESAETPMRILILEKGPEVLQKVRISGGGRCNVTHDCHDPVEFARRYPRGEKAMPGLLHRWNAADMIDWMETRGVALKTESDGRMFPVTDRSQTVIDCLLRSAEDRGVEVRCRAGVERIVALAGGGFAIEVVPGEPLRARHVLVATGGIRNGAGTRLAAAFGHTVKEAAPSLFTFHIDDARLEGLAGIAVREGVVRLPDERIEESGPILVTHWGLSGPAVLKASARGARRLRERDYRFPIEVNWAGGRSVSSIEADLAGWRSKAAKSLVRRKPPFPFPQRLWARLCEYSVIPGETRWSQLSRSQAETLASEIGGGHYEVGGKSMNKEEFVTCGGVVLKEVDLRTMESRLQPGLFFAGEVLDIDGLTGGFNFQAAWSTGRIAGLAIAARDTCRNELPG